MYEGIGASEGIGIGNVVMVQNEALVFEQTKNLSVEEEKTRLQQAIDTFLEKTAQMAERIREQVGDKEAQILEGHQMMISDPAMQEEMNQLLGDGKSAEEALSQVCDTFIMMFQMAEDELTRQRATDVNDLKNRILKILMGVEEQDLANLPPNTVLVAHDLTPSMTAQINKENVVGFVTETGGITSHSAILARALGIPAVLSVIGITGMLNDGEEVIVDGSKGVVVDAPDAKGRESYLKQKKKFQARKAELNQYFGKPTVTGDGEQVELVCNIGKPEDAKAIENQSGEGIGLFRTEFLFMDRTSMPSEDEQFEAYKEVAARLEGKPVIIRTLDIGGDKEIPYLAMEKEDNPFLGFRAIRYCLEHRELFQTQLRAIMRAGYYGDIRMMLPLVTRVEELRETKKLCKEIEAELARENIPFRENMPIGVMIETPAACQIADLLAKEAAFFSIGTNDLTAYTMSVDRGNAKVLDLNSYFHPAVLRSIRQAIRAANNAEIPVGMCGEAAADEKMIPLLLAFGLDEFSVNPVSVLPTRARIKKWTKLSAMRLAEQVMKAATKEEVEEILEREVSEPAL